MNRLDKSARLRLTHALEAAGIRSPKQLGKFLARMEGEVFNDPVTGAFCRLERIKRTSDGWLWHFVQVDESERTN